MKQVESFAIDEQLILQFMTPVVVLITIAIVYFVNVPGIQASTDIIKAMTAGTVKERLQYFNDALGRNSFADQEIVEQLAQQAMSIASNTKVPDADKKGFEQRAELELLKMNDEKKGDARLHSFLSSFYRSIGAYKQAQGEAAIARQLSPNKQAIITEQGVIELQLGDNNKAEEFFKTAFELDEANTSARVLNAAVLAGNDKLADAKALIGDQYLDAFALNDFALSMVDKSKDLSFLAQLLESRVKQNPEDAQNRASLAYAYYQLGDQQKAIDTLEQASTDIPAFTKTAQCFIGNLKKGEIPNKGC
jgi:tetratricopeptide (TPR) repeat protein